MTFDRSDPFRHLVSLEKELQRVRAQLQATHVGTTLVSTVISGGVPTGNGGSGIQGDPLGVFVAKNVSGSLRTKGDVVIFLAGTDQGFTTSTTLGTRRVIGIVDGSAESDSPDVADQHFARIKFAGYVPTLKVDGAVVAGDYLQHSTTATRATSTSTDPHAGAFARAWTAWAGPGVGTVAAMLFTAPEMLQEQVTAKGDLLVGAAAGDLDVLPVSANDGYYLAASPGDTLGMAWRPTAGGSGGGPIWIPFGSDQKTGFDQASDTYAQWGWVERVLNPTMFSFSPLHVVLEVVMKASAGATVKMRLFDVTAGAAVGSSEVTTTSSTPVRLRSPLLTLNAGDHRYIVQIGGATGGTYTGYDAAVIIGGSETTAGGVQGGGAVMMMLAGFGNMA